MTKLNIELLEEALKSQEAGLTPCKIEAILSKVRTLVEENKAPPVSRTVKPYAVVISDPEGKIPAGTEFTGWAIQYDEDRIGVGEVSKQLVEVAKDFNASRSGKKQPVASIGETFQVASRSLFKDQHLVYKHKDPVFVVVTDNSITKGVNA